MLLVQAQKHPSLTKKTIPGDWIIVNTVVERQSGFLFVGVLMWGNLKHGYCILKVVHQQKIQKTNKTKKRHKSCCREMKWTKSTDMFFLLTAHRWNNKPVKPHLQSSLSKHAMPLCILYVYKWNSASKVMAAENGVSSGYLCIELELSFSST